jgi:flagellar biosynthetic protein FliR
VAWLWANAESFILVLMRVGVLLFFFPFWDNRAIPKQIKVFMVLVIAVTLTPVVQSYLPSFPGTVWEAGLLLIKEFLLGLTLAIIIQIIFSGVLLAGELVGVQMGLGMAGILDPQMGGRSSLIASFASWIALLLFITMNGHHYLLRVLVESFERVPMGGQLPDWPRLPETIMRLSGQIFVIAITFLAPVLVVHFLSQVALALLSKAVPQVQIMIVSFPLTILLGVFFLTTTLSLTIPYLDGRFRGLTAVMDKVLRLMQG